jgi:hypothetical protein
MAQEWLKRRQKADGSFLRGQGTGGTSLSILALMVSGSVPGCGPYGEEVAKGVNYLISQAQPSGLIADSNSKGGVMYHHALSTLCLAEVWGMSVRKDIKPVLERAVRLIIRCQNKKGGWRYDPKPKDSDISVTVMQIVALRAAQNAGISVPQHTIDDAVKYVKNCHNKKEKGFGYNAGGSANIARTAAGVISLQLCGEYHCDEVKTGCEYLSENLDKKEVKHFYYAHYYAMQAMYQSRRGQDWTNWYFKAVKQIMDRQSKSGSSIGGYSWLVYANGMAILAVGLPYRYLPIYQR